MTAAIGAATAAVLASADPAILLPGTSATSTDAGFYARVYTVRALPMSAAIVGMLVTRRTRGLIPLLTVAGLAQVGDLCVAVGQRNPGMAAGSTLGALLHLGSVAWAGRPPAGE